MVLETLLVLLVLGAVVATVLSLFVLRSKKPQHRLRCRFRTLE